MVSQKIGFLIRDHACHAHLHRMKARTEEKEGEGYGISDLQVNYPPLAQGDFSPAELNNFRADDT
ncbi:hypothetical protein RJ53_04035 [Methanocalculus chunghsingensis]|uniref:Uncharacterized protein n=1 Tax=Methanocalculus chunghsingensis TaxID=156457 RepID=A0A8J7W6R0_9EURY|nr:hypothetical protein [Methanocalculus chunghsingensis]MBR1368721.1 hypothetical protein [Methanocalculus chunghsingensis]